MVRRSLFVVIVASIVILGVSGTALGAVGAIRVNGADRYETSAEVAYRAYSGGTPNVVIATGEDWPDALCAGPLADKVAAPILLTQRTSLPGSIATAIGTLGADRAYIIGGYGVIDVTVELDLIAAGIDPTKITRIAGTNRYDTSMQVAAFIENYDVLDVDTAFFATGDNFPDALAAGPFAAANAWPILLTRRDTIPPETQTAITGLALSNSHVLGGTGVISNAVMSQLPGAQRHGGTNRYETARLIAEYGIVCCGGQDYHLYTATGEAFPDALSAAPLAAAGPFPLIMLGRDTLPGPSELYINTHEPAITSWFLIGGTNAVSDVVRQQVHDILNP